MISCYFSSDEDEKQKAKKEIIAPSFSYKKKF